MKKRELTKTSLTKLAKSMPIINENTQRLFVGGCPESCVFNVFDYLDGDQYDSCHYYNLYKNDTSNVPNPDGGVPTDDISTIGSYGGFAVTEIKEGEPLQLRKGIALFNSNGIGHAVIPMNRRTEEDGTEIIIYLDPTTNQVDEKPMTEFTAFYRTSGSCTSGNTSGNI